MGLLFGEQLADRQREVLFEGFLVGLLGNIFALLRCSQQRVIVVANAQLALNVTPGAV